MVLTEKHLEEKYGEEYVIFFRKCIRKEAESSICKCDVCSMEQDLEHRNGVMISNIFNICDHDVEKDLHEFFDSTNRKKYMILAVSGFRIQKINNMIAAGVKELNPEIEFGYIRTKEEPYVNELLVIAY